MFLVSLISAFFLCLLLIPSVWAAVCSDDLDAHEYGIMRVSSRNPVRETGPPACMAKLIMMRHRIDQANTRKRGASQPRQPTRTASNPSLRASNRPRNLAWMRFGKRAGKQYH